MTHPRITHAEAYKHRKESHVFDTIEFDDGSIFDYGIGQDYTSKVQWAHENFGSSENWDRDVREFVFPAEDE